ncbi:MAG: phosphoribosyltransferase [Thermoproteus sp.]
MPKVPVKVVKWDEIVSWARKLAENIRSSGWSPDVVVAIARGGYVPARLLCDFLGVQDLLSVQVVHWPGAAQVAEKAYVKYGLSVDLSGKNVLVMDDIVDTGDSVVLAKEVVERCCRPKSVKTAALQVITSTTKFVPDYYAVEVRDWYWYQYPWTALEDMSSFIVRMLREEKQQLWTLDRLMEKFVEWYGNELLEERFLYFREALERLKRDGVLKPTDCGGLICYKYGQ